MVTSDIFLSTLADQCEEGKFDTSYLYGKLWWFYYSSKSLPFNLHLSPEFIDTDRCRKILDLYSLSEEFDSLLLLRKEHISTEELKQTLIALNLYREQWYFVENPFGDDGDEIQLSKEDAAEFIEEHKKSSAAKEMYKSSSEKYELNRGSVWNPQSGEEGFDPIIHSYSRFIRNENVEFESMGYLISIGS